LLQKNVDNKISRVHTYFFVDKRSEDDLGKVTHIMFDDGERYPMVIDDEGVPDFWLTLFVTENLRVSLTQTAIENTIRSLIHLQLWEETNGIALIDEFKQEKFLTDADIASIRDHCLLDTKNLRQWHRSLPRHNITRLSVSHPSSVRHLKSVSKNHAANRLAHISNFLKFTAEALLRQRSNYVSLVVQIEDMATRIKSQKPKGLGDKGLAGDPDDKAPPPEVFAKFMEVISETSPENPYLNPGIRVRNARMFELMHETGMRSGEVLGLYVEDIDYLVGIAKVKRRHDNPLDPRLRQPVAKTLARNIPISKALAKRLRNYVMEVRSKVPNANKWPFLFVTHKKGKYQGQPISDSTFKNRILAKATESNMELFEEICRHGFRHNFNKLLSEKIDAWNAKARLDPSLKIISEKEELQVRKQLNGWDSDDTAETYNLRHIQEVSEKIFMEDMVDNSTRLKGNRK
jgi:integrase